MENDISWIVQYIDSLHKESSIISLEKPVESKKKEINLEKVSLDMKILQQRMDSVSIVKYYKDLKNERLKLTNNITYVDNEEELFLKMNEINDNKPWPKLDNYTKKKKISNFIERLIIKDTSLNKIELEKELFKMLEDKKITKNTIQFDEHNNIITLGQYTMVD